MRSLFYQDAIRDDGDIVGVTDSRQPMRDYNGRPVCGDVIQRLLYDAFGLRVECACCFVQKENLRAGDDAPCYC